MANATRKKKSSFLSAAWSSRLWKICAKPFQENDAAARGGSTYMCVRDNVLWGGAEELESPLPLRKQEETRYTAGESHEGAEGEP